MVCEKKLDFPFFSMGGPKHGARVWCLGRVPKHRNLCQEVDGLLFSTKNSQLVHILSFHSYLRACMKLRIVQKIRFSLHESRWPKALCPGLVFGPSAKAQELLARIRGLVIQPPVEEDTSKIWDTTGTVFIQRPSILLLVWRSIMFNGSFLRVCRILRFVKKIRFCLLEYGRTKPWCLGLVSRPSAKAQVPVARTISWCIF